MIRLIFGNVGSSKTCCAVRELYHNPSNKITYSNIDTKGIKNNILIKADMIIKKVPLGENRKGVMQYDLKLNEEFWKNVIKKHKSINIILDEAHTILNSRRAMSKPTRIMLDFVALLRRILGSSDGAYGTLSLITQLERRLDVVVKEMATNIRYHMCHYSKTCKSCNFSFTENNEVPEPIYKCPRCNQHTLITHNHVAEVWHFSNIEKYTSWKEFGSKTYHKHYYVHELKNYFSMYDTLQWDNLLSEF